MGLITTGPWASAHTSHSWQGPSQVVTKQPAGLCLGCPLRGPQGSDKASSAHPPWPLWVGRGVQIDGEGGQGASWPSFTATPVCPPTLLFTGPCPLEIPHLLSTLTALHPCGTRLDVSTEATRSPPLPICGPRCFPQHEDARDKAPPPAPPRPAPFSHPPECCSPFLSDDSGCPTLASSKRKAGWGSDDIVCR